MTTSRNRPARPARQVAHALPPAGDPGPIDSSSSPQQQPAPPGAAAAGSGGGAAFEEGPIWAVPWDFFEATRTFGLLWVANQAIPALVISLAAKAQGLEMGDLPAGQQVRGSSSAGAARAVCLSVLALAAAGLRCCLQGPSQPPAVAVTPLLSPIRSYSASPLKFCS